jgi:hypothetical protein
MRWNLTLARVLLGLWTGLCWGMLVPPAPTQAQDRAARDGEEDEANLPPNWQVGTLGGKQFWTDELIHGEWRIQRNVLTGHHRLLDPENKRRAWGTWEGCLEQWQLIRKDEHVPPLKPNVVIVLHGLARSRSSMSGLVDYLRKNSSYEVMSFGYASTRVPLKEDAKSLAGVISRMEGVKELSFVAHSMGNLVVRHFLHDQLAAARGLGNDPRIQRFVMLAPPNNGASLAERLQYDPTFRIVYGTGGQQFTKEWDELQKHLAVPFCPFGIIAGGAADGSERNPMLEGNDDLIVTVEETRLPGAADFVVLPVIHSFIMDDPRVQEYTLRFLEKGFFVSEEARQPIPAKPKTPDHAP